MKKNLKWISIYLILTCIKSFLPHDCRSQNPLFYISTENQQLLKVDIGNCDTTFIGYTVLPLNDIALTPDNRLYGIVYNTLLEVDTSNAAVLTISNSLGISGTSLVSDSAGNLLTASNDSIYQIDRFTGSIISLGYFGNYNSVGDMTFYHDTLYLVGNGNKLVQVNLQPVVSAQQIGVMSTHMILGLNTLCLNNTETMIASVGNHNYGSLYSVNPANAALSLLCDTIFPDQIYGAASQSYLIPPANCASLSSVQDLKADGAVRIYPNPTGNILNVEYEQAGKSVLKIMNPVSQLLMQVEFIRVSSINIEALNPGIYFYQLEHNNSIVKQGKLLKIN